jgi:hypothetical protein
MKFSEKQDDKHLNGLPWQVVSLEDYAVPADLSASALKKRWRSFSSLFHDGSNEADLARAEAELRALPNVRLANLVPPIDWGLASTALANVLDAADSKVTTTASRTIGTALSVNGEHPVQFFVGQPYCDHPTILTDWARCHHAQVLMPPNPKDILAGDTGWQQTLSTIQGRPWVLPALERCFLRHSNGLDLLRSFLERALSGALGPGIIGCDSWAFAFVRRLWPLPGTPVLTLQAFDGPALADYFVRTQRASENNRHIRFLSARSGEPLVPYDEPESSTDRAGARGEREQTLPEMRQLAAHCRGNPGLAWHYWRKQLRTEPDHEEQNSAEGHDSHEKPHGWQGMQSDEVVWVAPDLAAPSLPAETGEDVAFILHVLLLHRGLSADLLALLLPMPRPRVMSALLRLQVTGLLVREDEYWQIAPLAYPTVREFLRVRSYLIDAF